MLFSYIPTADLKNIGKIFEYDIVTKEVDKDGNEIGQMFIKKSNDRNGHLDGITKKLFDGEEIFHIAYYSKIKRVLKRLEGKIIDGKLTNQHNELFLCKDALI